jgi:phosphatidylinositol glycan class A protein
MRATAASSDGAVHHRICMVCDFFYPRKGGVEMHIWSLAQALLSRGHKVIIVTHVYGNRAGVRHMTDGLKVYYCPMVPFVDDVTFPTMLAFLPLFRQILKRETIDVVHCHQATSQLTHECLLHAGAMGYPTVYTDHSLFGFADVASIHINKALRFALSDVGHCICVSRTCRENLVLRCALDPHEVSAIPNAVDALQFTPEGEEETEETARRRGSSSSSRRGSRSGRRSDRRRSSSSTDDDDDDDDDTVTIVIMSRLVYRKGIDLAVDVIPRICAAHPRVRFVIGGDGPKRIALEEMREAHELGDRVELLGAVEHSRVRDVLVRGDIFLNCSLTESFCIAIVEAASCGLLVVSTAVGGVPEVLPDDMCLLAQPNVDALEAALNAAHDQIASSSGSSGGSASGAERRWDFHSRVREMYRWTEVAERTECVYQRVRAQPQRTLFERMERYARAGPVLGALGLIVVMLDFTLLLLLEYFAPATAIELAHDVPWRGARIEEEEEEERIE